MKFNIPSTGLQKIFQGGKIKTELLFHDPGGGLGGSLEEAANIKIGLLFLDLSAFFSNQIVLPNSRRDEEASIFFSLPTDNPATGLLKRSGMPH